jgi:hypothetical protein
MACKQSLRVSIRCWYALPATAWHYHMIRCDSGIGQMVDLHVLALNARLGFVIRKAAVAQGA